MTQDEKHAARVSKGHTPYKLSDGTRVPGCTTITGILDKPALKKWAWEMGAKGIELDKYVDELAVIGTLAHYLIECHCKSIKPDLGDYTPNQISLAENSAIKWIMWQDSCGFKPEKNELILVSERYRFGGTVDMIGTITTILPWMGDGVGAAPEAVVPGAKLTGKIQKIEGFGLFVWLGPGRVGLVPRAWTGLPPGSRLDARFRPGDDLSVEVYVVSEDGHRIRLEIEGVPRGEDREPEARAPRPSKEVPRSEPPAPEGQQETFGTNLGDALRAALRKK